MNEADRELLESEARKLVEQGLAPDLETARSMLLKGAQTPLATLLSMPLVQVRDFLTAPTDEPTGPRRVMVIDGKESTFARCNFCGDGLMVPPSDVEAQTKGGKPYLCSICRNIPEEERARIDAIPDNAISD